MMNLTTPHDFALAYARAGYRVLPCSGKIPLTQHGAKDATSDENILTAWWKRWPQANIGLALSELIAVDVDPRNGGNIENLPHPLPETCFARTGGGGFHYLYRTHNGTKYPGTLGKGIDLKSGPGCYIVVEPSIHASGGKYVWLDETEPWTTTPATAPEWLARPSNTKSEPDTPQDGIEDGQRNAHLISLAGTMQRRAMAPAAILAALQAENAARCNPPLTDEEVGKIAASISRYAPGKDEHSTPPSPSTAVERIRRVELRALDTRANVAGIDALAEIGLRFGRPRETSGLVEMQKWFMKFARMQRLLPPEVDESVARSLAGPSPKGVTKAT